MQESNRVVFKRELTDKLEREVVSFLNYSDGMERILSVYDKSIFEFTPNFMRAVFRFEKFEEESSEQNAVEIATEETRVKSRVKILDAIRQQPTIIRMELAEVLQLSGKAIEKNLSILKQEGLLRRVGPDKGGRWEVIDMAVRRGK